MANCLSFMVSLILFGGLETLGVLSDGKLVDDLLDITVHEDRQIVHRVIDAMVGHSGLRIVVGTYLGGAVSCGHHRLTLLGHLIEILLVYSML